MKGAMKASLEGVLRGAKVGGALIDTSTITVEITQTSVIVKYDPFPVPAAAAAQPAVTTTAPAVLPVVPATTTGTTI